MVVVIARSAATKQSRMAVIARSAATKQSRRATLLLAVAMALATACDRGNRYAPPPPPDVTVARPIEQEVTTYNEFTGYTAAVEAVDVRARVQGYLQSVNFV